MFGSTIFFNLFTDQAGSIVDSYIRSTIQKKEVFKDTLDYVPNGVVLIDVQEK
jgi:hypothetical protein